MALELLLIKSEKREHQKLVRKCTFFRHHMTTTDSRDAYLDLKLGDVEDLAEYAAEGAHVGQFPQGLELCTP